MFFFLIDSVLLIPYWNLELPSTYFQMCNKNNYHRK